jgi:hypothetical protein
MKNLLETLTLVVFQLCVTIQYSNGFLQPLAVVSKKTHASFVLPSKSNNALVRSSASSDYEYALIFDCDGKRYCIGRGREYKRYYDKNT